MAYYITTYNSVDLQATCGVVTPGVRGVHDLPDRELSILNLPGGTAPHVTPLRWGYRTLRFAAVVAAETHADLVANIEALKAVFSADDDFHALVVADRPGKQIMALAQGFDVDTDVLPNEITALEIPITFLAYPYWEDATALTAKITSTFLSYRQATIEHTALDGWHSLTGGLPTLETADPYAGDYCMQVVAVGGGDTGAKTPEAGITGITAGNDYSLQMYLKGAAGGETVTAAIRFFKADNTYISEATGNFNLTTAWAQYKIEGAAAPALAAKASVQIRDAHASTFYVDEVCLEEAATCGAFITPADANTKLVNDGPLTCYPVYTITILDTLATGCTLTVGSSTFDYDGALAAADVLVVDTDPQAPSVSLGGAVDMANTAVDAAFPPLVAGSSTVTLSDPTKMIVAPSWRRRYL